MEPRPAVVITYHAMERWIQRTGCEPNAMRVEAQLRTALAEARRVWIKPEFRLAELLKHANPATYYRRGELVFVVVENSLVTVHKGTADRWTDVEPQREQPTRGRRRRRR